MNRGFTLVELVAVISLLGVVLAIISSRFALVDPFDQRIGEDGVLSLLRKTQQSAFGVENVSVTIETSGSNVVFSQIVSGAARTARSFPTNEVAITAGSVGSGTACGSISSTITLNFDSAGEIETVDDDGFPICLNGESSLCISPAGFAHEGACL
jgi:prepilin-type N-terminal cleavage/methylation domain-containing protein